MRQVSFAPAMMLIILGIAVSAHAGDEGIAASLDAQQAHMQAFSVGDYQGALQAFGGRVPETMEPMLRSSWNQFCPVLDGVVVQGETLPSSSDQLSGEDLARLQDSQ